MRFSQCRQSVALQMALAAAVVSLNPSIIARQNTGIDSEELQAVQRKLLTVMRDKKPDALYPAALCTLADLVEVRNVCELGDLANQSSSTCQPWTSLPA